MAPAGKMVDRGECLILGNGPSLNHVLQHYSTELKQNTLICVNKFPDTPFFTTLKPAYYIFVSPQYWEVAYSDPNSPERNQIIEALIQKTSWKLTVLCPYGAKKNPAFIQRLQKNKHLSILFFNDTPIEGLPELSHFFLKRRWGAPRPHNVMIPATLMGIHLGFKKLFLLGADHSWLPMIEVTDKNEALINRKHFYDVETALPGKMYNLQQRPRALHEILEKFVYTFRSYIEIEEFARAEGVQIYNATPGSFIDAFERVTYQTLFPTSHQESESQ